jgi:hypothetical protein
MGKNWEEWIGFWSRKTKVLEEQSFSELLFGSRGNCVLTSERENLAETKNSLSSSWVPPVPRPPNPMQILTETHLGRPHSFLGHQQAG